MKDFQSRKRLAAKLLPVPFFTLIRGLVWIGLIAVVILAVTRCLDPNRGTAEAPLRKRRTASVTVRIPWEQVDEDIEKSLRAAAKRAEKVAAGELDRWTGELRQRIDNDFLAWYFGYWQTQLRGLNMLKYTVLSLRDRLLGREHEPGPADRLAEDIAAEFAARVLHPQAAQLRIERITREALAAYSEVLDVRLHNIAMTYEIPAPLWDRYLESISWTVTDVSTGRNIPLSIKAAAALPAACMLGIVVERAAAGTVARTGLRSTAGTLASSGGAIATKLATRTLPVLFAAVIAWEIWDHHRVKKEGIPVLRRALFDYLGEMRHDILDGQPDGIMTAVREINAAAVKALSNRSAMPQFD